MNKTEFSFLNPADQLEKLGFVVGDVITGIETSANGGQHQAELTILWIGDKTAVCEMRCRNRPSAQSMWEEWSDRGESANWNFAFRQWEKVNG